MKLQTWQFPTCSEWENYLHNSWKHDRAVQSTVNQLCKLGGIGQRPVGSLAVCKTADALASLARSHPRLPPAPLCPEHFYISVAPPRLTLGLTCPESSSSGSRCPNAASPLRPRRPAALPPLFTLQEEARGSACHRASG